MRHNQASSRNRRTRMPSPPRSRCMLPCRPSFCMSRPGIPCMFRTFLYTLHHNSRPPPSPQHTQRTRSRTKRPKAACRAPRARLYTQTQKWDLGYLLFLLKTFTSRPFYQCTCHSRCSSSTPHDSPFFWLSPAFRKPRSPSPKTPSDRQTWPSRCPRPCRR